MAALIPLGLQLQQAAAGIILISEPAVDALSGVPVDSGIGGRMVTEELWGSEQCPPRLFRVCHQALVCIGNTSVSSFAPLGAKAIQHTHSACASNCIIKDEQHYCATTIKNSCHAN